MLKMPTIRCDCATRPKSSAQAARPRNTGFFRILNCIVLLLVSWVGKH
jgi:hypothetical protein